MTWQPAKAGSYRTFFGELLASADSCIIWRAGMVVSSCSIYRTAGSQPKRLKLAHLNQHCEILCRSHVSLEVLSEGSERGEEEDADLADEDEFDSDYRRLPWGAARTPAAAAEAVARVLATDPEIRPTAQVLIGHPACLSQQCTVCPGCNQHVLAGTRAFWLSAPLFMHLHVRCSGARSMM